MSERNQPLNEQADCSALSEDELEQVVGGEPAYTSILDQLKTDPDLPVPPTPFGNIA